MSRFFRRLAEFIESKYMLVIVIAALLLGGAGYGLTHIRMESGFGTILPAGSQVMIDYEKYSDEFGGEQIIVLVSADNAAELLSTDNLTAMGSVGADLADNTAVTSIISPAFLLQQAVE